MTAMPGLEADPAMPASVAASEAADDPWLDAPFEDFAETVRSEFERVWRLLRRLGVPAPDADDATQQVFLVLSRKWREIDRRRVRRFLYATSLRIAANVRRGLRRRREVLDDTWLDTPSSDAPQPERLELERARHLLDELLERLPDELRRVFVLAEIEELTTLAIAGLEDIPHGTAASRLRRARAAFGALLERERHRNPFSEQP
jgi:RNA polymerase sigma-70 factor (ECF subfamily)